MTWTGSKYLEAVKARAENAASASSDDFGHSVTDCQVWQVQQLDRIADDTAALVARVVELEAALKDIADQKTVEEVKADEGHQAGEFEGDIEGAYETMIGAARAALATPPPEGT